jgi:NLI interacting factor-like phosphatase
MSLSICCRLSIICRSHCGSRRSVLGRLPLVAARRSCRLSTASARPGGAATDPPRMNQAASAVARIQLLTGQQSYPASDRFDRDREPNKNKKNAKAASSQQLPLVENANGRPGKKKLRQLRYQQQQLSEIEFLLLSAQNATFTRSVVVMMSEPDASLLSSTTTTTTTTTPRTVQVTTTTTSASTSTASSHRSQRKIASQAVNIRVQPLLVLDLNGVLCHRIRRSDNGSSSTRPMTAYRPSVATIANTPIIPRTDLTDFLTFLDQHFCLAIWTSAQAKTARLLVERLVPRSVADRFLFVWSQQHCDTVMQNGEGARGISPDLLFQKDLAKVWKEFPLWNVSNTLIMDDSADKCAAWHENAIHPPPLHGLQLPYYEQQQSSFLPLRDESNGGGPIFAISDQENQQGQRLFMERLVQHWQEQPVTQEWDEESGDATLYNSTAQLRFLQEHAAGHMGWN